MGEKKRKRRLTSLIKSRLVCAIGRHQLWWRKRRRRWRGCEQNAVQPGADVGVKERGKKRKTQRVAGCIQMMDRISKEEPSPSVHPSSSISPHPQSLSCSISISQKRIQQPLKCFFSQDGSHLANTEWATIMDRSFLFLT